MTIYAYITKIGNNEPQFRIVNSAISFFTPQEYSKQIAEEIKNFDQTILKKIAHKMSLEQCYVKQYGKLFLHIRKTEHGITAFIADEELNKTQAAPYFHKLDEVIKSNLKIEQIEKNGKEAHKALSDAVNSAIERNGRLEDLVDKADDLKFHTKAFEKKTESLNSCWPCNLF